MSARTGEVSDGTMAKQCKWCETGPPEWSHCAKIWIHRRLNRRCTNPPSNYGYTMQVPEETASSLTHQTLAE